MKRGMMVCGSILLLIVIGSLFVCAVSAETIIIDTEKGEPRFWTEPARDLPANWHYVQDHPDSSADGWFDTNAYPPGRGNGSFWYTISFPDMGECKGGPPTRILLTHILTNLHRPVSTCQRNEHPTKCFIMVVWLL